MSLKVVSLSVDSGYIALRDKISNQRSSKYLSIATNLDLVTIWDYKVIKNVILLGPL